MIKSDLLHKMVLQLFKNEGPEEYHPRNVLKSESVSERSVALRLIRMHHDFSLMVELIPPLLETEKDEKFLTEVVNAFDDYNDISYETPLAKFVKTSSAPWEIKEKAISFIYEHNLLLSCLRASQNDQLSVVILKKLQEQSFNDDEVLKQILGPKYSIVLGAAAKKEKEERDYFDNLKVIVNSENKPIDGFHMQIVDGTDEAKKMIMKLLKEEEERQENLTESEQATIEESQKNYDSRDSVSTYNYHGMKLQFGELAGRDPIALFLQAVKSEDGYTRSLGYSSLLWLKDEKWLAVILNGILDLDPMVEKVFMTEFVDFFEPEYEE